MCVSLIIFLTLRTGIRSFYQTFQWQWIAIAHYNSGGTAVLNENKFMPQMFYIIGISNIPIISSFVSLIDVFVLFS